MTTPTVSSVLAQVQEEIATTATTLNTIFENAKAQPAGNIPASFEAQLLGGQIIFQQDIDEMRMGFVWLPAAGVNLVVNLSAPPPVGRHVDLLECQAALTLQRRRLSFHRRLQS